MKTKSTLIIATVILGINLSVQAGVHDKNRCCQEVKRLSVEKLKETRDPEMKLEKWMIAESFSNTASMDVESWMLNEKEFSKPLNTEAEASIENWMTQVWDINTVQEENQPELEHWMVSF